IASTLRLTTISSRMFMMTLALGSWLLARSLRAKSKQLRASFRRYHLIVALQRRVQRMPRERGAFYAGRELRHSGERRQPAQFFFVEAAAPLAGDELVERIEQLLRLGALLPLHRRAHHRRRRLRDRAAVAGEADVLDRVAVEL